MGKMLMLWLITMLRKMMNKKLFEFYFYILIVFLLFEKNFNIIIFIEILLLELYCILILEFLLFSFKCIQIVDDEVLYFCKWLFLKKFLFEMDFVVFLLQELNIHAFLLEPTFRVIFQYFVFIGKKKYI